MTKVKTIWENRYAKGGDSGAGSYSVLCDFKSKIINEFIHEKCCESMIEFGCGDGNQQQSFKIRNYVGIDISDFIIEKCKTKFNHITNRNFMNYTDFYKNKCKCDISVSLDVIYHIVDDTLYHTYMNDLFSASNKFVIIYSSNFQDSAYNGSHVYHRKFTDYIGIHFPNAELIKNIKNDYPEQSSAEFFIYQI